MIFGTRQLWGNGEYKQGIFSIPKKSLCENILNLMLKCFII